MTAKQRGRAALPELTMTDPGEWRRWLEENHLSSPGIWLLFHKRHTGVESIPYEEAVREALAFGWIDSLIRRIDDDRFARKFTPRSPTSRWSEINRKRWAEMKEAGRLAPPGLAAAPTAKTYAPKPVIPALPGYIAQAFKASPSAWRFFRELAPTDRRQFVMWIHTAKRSETRLRRIQEAITLLKAGKKLGLR